MWIRGLVHLVGVYCLWRLWGTIPALFWTLLAVMALEWSCAEAVRQSVKMHAQDPEKYPASRYARGGSIANFWVYCSMGLILLTLGLIVSTFVLT